MCIRDRLTLCPIFWSSLAKFRRLLQVQSKGDSGSPRLVGSTSVSRSDKSVGSLSTLFLRPPPGTRILSSDEAFPFSSLSQPSELQSCILKVYQANSLRHFVLASLFYPYEFPSFEEEDCPQILSSVLNHIFL